MSLSTIEPRVLTYNLIELLGRDWIFPGKIFDPEMLSTFSSSEKISKKVIFIQFIINFVNILKILLKLLRIDAIYISSIFRILDIF